MNNLLSSLMQQATSGQMQNNPMMSIFNQMMQGKSNKDKIQTLLNSAKSKGFDIEEKRFTEQDLKILGLK